MSPKFIVISGVLLLSSLSAEQLSPGPGTVPGAGRQARPRLGLWYKHSVLWVSKLVWQGDSELHWGRSDSRGFFGGMKPGLSPGSHRDRGPQELASMLGGRVQTIQCEVKVRKG